MDPSIDRHLRRLSRALVQNRIKDVYANHRELYLVGKEVLPNIADQLLAYSWKTVKFKEQLRLLSGLLNLALDIDEAVARKIAERIEEKGCSNSIRSILHSILGFSLDHFNRFSVEKVAVYYSKELEKDARAIESKLTRWLLAVPAGDLNSVDRIYIVPSCGFNAAGIYAPLLCKIAVQWDVPSNPFSRWLWLLRVERTLYHEIGHHVHRHNRIGQDPDQEEEADDYAKKVIGKNHPFFRAVGTVLAKLLRRQRRVDSGEQNVA